MGRVLHRSEALRILKAKLAAVEEEHQVESAVDEDVQTIIDARAEAQALAALFDFLKDCKIEPTNSLLRIFKRYIFKRYLHPSLTATRGRVRGLDS
jgi:hypothetical protein